MHEERDVSAVIRFGPFTLDERSGELRKGPTRLRVPDQSIAILRELVQSPGELVTREALRDRLWAPDTHVDFEAGLNAAVRRLREALNDSADAPRYVETLPRRGYRFIAPVEAVSTGVSSAPLNVTPAEAPAAAAAEPVPGPRVRVRSVVLTICALALLGAAVWAVSRPNNAAPTGSAAGRPIPITRLPGLEVEPAISPTGTFVAFAWDGKNEDNFDIYVRSIDGSNELQLTSDAAADHAPAWSPDGQRIAFVRVVAGRRVIMVMPALGGPEQRLFEAGMEPGAWFLGGSSIGLSWTPDGKYLVFGDRNVSSLTSAIYLYSLEDGQRRQLTTPPANLSDTHPVVSPDGRYLAFVRQNPFANGGSVFLQKLEHLRLSGEPAQLTFGHTVNAFDWTQDSRSVIHDAGRVEPGLWRIAVVGGRPELVLSNVTAARRPSVARSGAGVAYQTTVYDSNIWELRTPSSPNRGPSVATSRVIASTSGDTDMRFSPNGTRIAFASLRSGHSELWVSNRDGTLARRLTNYEGGGRVGSPSWSADGKWIAFDAIQTGTGNWNLHLLAADGGPTIQTLTSDTSNNVRPSWSLDGQWIYFGSDRTGDWQIWRMPSAGGTPERITRGGGMSPIVSPDGRHVYYAKPTPVQGIWEVPPEGGPEVKVVDRGRALSFAVADTGIFIMDTSAKPQATIDMFSFASRQLVPVARLPSGLRFISAAYLTVTRDGRSMLYIQFDHWASDIEMLPGFR